MKRSIVIPLLTPSGFLLLGSMLVVPVLGLLADLSLAICLALALVMLSSFVVLLLIDLNQVRRALASSTYKLELSPRSYSAVPTRLLIFLSLPHKAWLRHLMIRPAIPNGVAIVEESVAFQLHADKQVIYPFAFTPLGRGTITWEMLWIRLMSPTKLFSFQCRLEPPEPVNTTVYPNPFCQSDRDTKALTAQGFGSDIFSHGAGEGREFDSLRHYGAGDDLRRVDWKRSAKRGSLVVKQYRPETHQRLLLVMDCSRRMGNRIERRLQLDFAADAAAYLLRLAVENDDEVGFLAFHHQIQAQIPCRRGRRQQSLIMENLLQMRLGSLEGDYSLVRRWGQANRRRSLLVLITSIANPASFTLLRESLLPLATKHLPLVVAIHDRDLQQLVSRSVNTVEEAFIAAAGFEQMESTKRCVKLLRQSGIECLHSDVLDIPSLLRDKYYQLKMAGRL